MTWASARGASVAEGDSLPTILAIGVLAYVGETVGHELLGHGGVCLLDGGRITALAPLWMRCSVHTIPMVVAGPAFNFAVGGLCAAILKLQDRSDTLGYFLWLSCSFNLLVAFGYLMVGGATTLGDWGVVFASVQPQWAWRLALAAVGLAGYLIALRTLATLYERRDDRLRGRGRGRSSRRRITGSGARMHPVRVLDPRPHREFQPAVHAILHGRTRHPVPAPLDRGGHPGRGVLRGRHRSDRLPDPLSVARGHCR